MNTFVKYALFTALLPSATGVAMGQSLKLNGYFDFDVYGKKDKVSASLGEQDVFITGEISDRISFLGESVFKIASHDADNLTLALERAIIKYNFYGNHNLLFGKVHTPLNYWNDTYHHGRLFFPTIFRPALFAAQIIPIHTTGIGIQGHDLGKLKFGYDLFAGNGIGAGDVADNDKYKSVTAAVLIKPLDHVRIGASTYYDVISPGADVHTGVEIEHQVTQMLYTASASYFGKKFEFLAEGTYGIHQTDTLGNAPSLAYYAYAGFRLFKKVVVYGRFDQLLFDEKEMYFVQNDLMSLVGGIRYEINYLAVVKIEFQHDDTDLGGEVNSVNAQFAIGF